MKRVYKNPVIEVTTLNACSVLCASDPKLSTPTPETKDKPMGAY